jgi:hypothetical protein
MVRSSDRSIVRPFVRPNNLFSAIMLPKFRSFDHSIVHRSFIVPIHRSSFVRSSYSSFFQIIFVMPKFRSFVRPIIRSSFVRPDNLCHAVMLPKFRSFVRPIIRSFVRSFVQIIFSLPLCCRNSDRSFVRSFDRSSFVHSSYSSFIVRS